MLKALADNNFNVTKNIILVLHRVENIVEKGKKAGYQHFLLFPQSSQAGFPSGSSKAVIVWYGAKFKK